MIRAYEEQIEFVEAQGGRDHPDGEPRAGGGGEVARTIMLRVYDRILGQVKQPVIIHWLGEMFDPALAGYWGSGDH